MKYVGKLIVLQTLYLEYQVFSSGGHIKPMEQFPSLRETQVILYAPSYLAIKLNMFELLVTWRPFCANG